MDESSYPATSLFIERLLFSFVLFLVVWAFVCCWRVARRNQRAALSDGYERRNYLYQPVRTDEINLSINR